MTIKVQVVAAKRSDNGRLDPRLVPAIACARAPHRIFPSLHRQRGRLIIVALPDNSAVDLVKSNVLLRDKSLSRKAKKA